MINHQIAYKVSVLFLGALPATFWLLLSIYYFFGITNDSDAYMAWVLFILVMFVSIMGFWLELFWEKKTFKYRIWVISMMITGTVITFYIYSLGPRIFTGLVLFPMFSPVVAAAIVIVAKVRNRTGVETING